MPDMGLPSLKVASHQAMILAMAGVRDSDRPANPRRQPAPTSSAAYPRESHKQHVRTADRR
jgi:hypothetical protein